MAIKPVIKQITPFDVSDGVTISSTYSGNMPYYNRVTIQDAQSLTTVYSRLVESRKYEHFVDPNFDIPHYPGDVAYNLQNGRRYAVTIQYFDSDRTTELSAVSDKLSFLTRTAPIFHFEDLVDGQQISSSTLTLTIYYLQREAEPILNYQFQIYDSAKTLLQETTISYDTSDMSHVYKGLNNQQTYYVRALATTKNGIKLDTGLVSVYVYYQDPGTYAMIYAECNTSNSVVNYETNFVLIESDEDSDSLTYDGTWVIVNKGTVTYSKGYGIEDDGTWFIKARNVKYPVTLFTCSNGEERFVIEALKSNNTDTVFRLTVGSGYYTYRLYSDPVMLYETDEAIIWVRKVNNVYDFKVFVRSIAVASQRTAFRVGTNGFINI